VSAFPLRKNRLKGREKVLLHPWEGTELVMPLPAASKKNVRPIRGEPKRYALSAVWKRFRVQGEGENNLIAHFHQEEERSNQNHTNLLGENRYHNFGEGEDLM